MKYCSFPIGYPKVHARETFANAQPWTRPEQNGYKGLIYCRVRAPTTLRRPLLPYHTTDGRLVFPLCRRCADERIQLQQCTHTSDADRTWAEAFTHEELNKALALGYVVTDVYEVHEFEKWAHYGGTGDQLPLFVDYINAFIKMKLEASGWPSPDMLEDEKQAYIDRCRTQDGIELERAELDKGLNPALRQIAVSVIETKKRIENISDFHANPIFRKFF